LLHIPLQEIAGQSGDTQMGHFDKETKKARKQFFFHSWNQAWRPWQQNSLNAAKF